jgi:hypothetical protein
MLIVITDDSKIAVHPRLSGNNGGGSETEAEI